MGEGVDGSEDLGENFARMGIGDHSTAESILASELNQMSVQERDLISDEIHGVRLCCPDETPELLKNSLEYLSEELNSLPSTPTKLAYEESLKFPESYVHTDDFRLIFLRCEFFDAKKAAVRMTKYLDVAKWAFGPKILKRDICLADFDQKAKQYLREGHQQVLPGMDRAGRRIGGNFAFEVDPKQTIKNRIKSSLFVLMRCVKANINVQRTGMVGIFWAIRVSQFDDVQKRFWAHRRVDGALPVRICAAHCCLPQANEQISRFVSTMYLMCQGSEHRKRVRFHTGSATECLYKLQTFGIQAIHMPINTNTGKIKTANHHKWLQLQKIQEDAILGNKKFSGIECPEQGDILFGRGWPKMSHPGNAIFRNALESRLEEYNAAKTKKEKTVISWSIVGELKESGARFLREDDSGFWMEVSNEVARQKVSIGFRDVRKARQKLNASMTLNSPAEASIPSKSAASSKRKAQGGHSSDEEASAAFSFLDGGKRHRTLCGGNEKCF